MILYQILHTVLCIDVDFRFLSFSLEYKKLGQKSFKWSTAVFSWRNLMRQTFVTQKEPRKKSNYTLVLIPHKVFFSLTLHVISFNQTFFFLPKRKKPDETYRKSYDVYSNRDATRSEIFVSVLSIFEAMGWFLFWNITVFPWIVFAAFTT